MTTNQVVGPGMSPYLLVSHFVLQGLQLALMLAPQLSLLKTQLMPELLLLIPLPLPPSNSLGRNSTP